MEIDQQSAPKNFFKIFTFFLLALLLSIIALRTAQSELPSPQSPDELISLNTALYSLVISSILVLIFAVWFILRLLNKNFQYRPGGIEIGLLLLIIASFVAGSAASDKRAAITNAVVLIAPILMAIVLIQILDTGWKIKLTLAVIAAAGFLCAYQSYEQFSATNQMTIQQYNQDPNSMLQTLGIEPGTLQHWQFERHLLSKDIRGFFTTSNSAGSFLILAFFCALTILLDKIKNRKLTSIDPWHIIFPAIVAAAVFAGLVLTRSKGAIIAWLLSAFAFVVYMLCKNFLASHKKLILIIFILLIPVAVVSIILYGQAHNTLPGGKSLLLRWQYWLASVNAYLEKPLTGIGPGNFSIFFFHHKLPQAHETISDPHNFILSILTQYGPLGLIAFLAVIFVPLLKIIFSKSELISTEDIQFAPKHKKSVIIFASAAILLFIRPILSPIPQSAPSSQYSAAFLVLFIMPAVAFVIGMLLLTSGKLYSPPANQNFTYPLFFAAAGLLIHNLIDFAIFEPPVFTAFCAILACIIASHLNRNANQKILLPKPAAKFSLVIVFIAVSAAFLYFCLIPPLKSTSKIIRANSEISLGTLGSAHTLLSEAADDDKLSPFAPSFNSQIYMQNFLSSPQQELLLDAEKSFLEAVHRNLQNYKNYERLTTLYLMLSGSSQEPQKTMWLNKALENANKAVELYPSSDRLWFALAQIAESMGKVEQALDAYKKAVEIEDLFRQQFELLYSSSKPVSRLGNDKYNLAKQKIQQLSNPLLQP